VAEMGVGNEEDIPARTHCAPLIIPIPAWNIQGFNTSR
jgi:hypothetical protein